MSTYTPDIQFAGNYFVTSETLDSGDHLDVNFGDVDHVGHVVKNIAHGASCDVKLRVEAEEGDSWSGVREVVVDSFSGEGISQGNEIEMGDQNSVTLRITDTSGGVGNDYIVSGRR